MLNMKRSDTLTDLAFRQTKRTSYRSILKIFVLLRKTRDFPHQIGAVNSLSFMNCKLNEAKMTNFVVNSFIFLDVLPVY